MVKTHEKNVVSSARNKNQSFAFWFMREWVLRLTMIDWINTDEIVRNNNKFCLVNWKIFIYWAQKFKLKTFFFILVTLKMACKCEKLQLMIIKIRSNSIYYFSCKDNFLFFLNIWKVSFFFFYFFLLQTQAITIRRGKFDMRENKNKESSAK